MISGLPAFHSRLDHVKYHYDSDPICSSILKYCRKGWPEKLALNETLQPYWAFRGEFTVQEGLLLKGIRLVIGDFTWGNFRENSRRAPRNCKMYGACEVISLVAGLKHTA